MASKRILKNGVNVMIFDIVEECYDVQFLDDKKTEASEKLIDEAVDYREEILAKINAANSKAEFKPIREELETKAIDFIKKLNALNK